MRPSDFKRWRKALGYSQKDAAEALGLKRRVLQYYEKGERDGGRVVVPKTVRLACYALASGISDYHGPEQKPPPVAAAEETAAARQQQAPDSVPPPPRPSRRAKAAAGGKRKPPPG